MIPFKNYIFLFVYKIRLLIRQILLESEIHVINKKVTKHTGFKVTDIPSYTLPGELTALYQLAEASPDGAQVLEIGSHLGKSACFIASGLAHKNAKLYCVDTWQNQTMPEGEMDTFPKFETNIRNFRDIIHPIRKHSELLEQKDMPSILDFVFIDGDHSYNGAKNDFNKIKEIISLGGIVAFHDAVSPHFPGVVRVIGEALASGEWAMGGQVDTLLWIFRKSDSRLI